MNVKERWQYVYLHCSVFFFSLFSCLETLPIIGVYYAIKSAYTNEMMEPLWKQPSRGFESYFKKKMLWLRDTQNYPDKNGLKVIMDKRCSRCLEPFDKLKWLFGLSGTSTAV